MHKASPLYIHSSSTPDCKVFEASSFDASALDWEITTYNYESRTFGEIKQQMAAGVELF